MARKRVHLTFPEDLVQEPVLYNLARRFEIVTNIRRANVEERFGWVILEIEGDDATLAQGLDYMRGLGVQINEIAGDVVEG